MNTSKFQLIMISAMYENGGNTLQRYFDGHPSLYVYPFESQLGTALVSDYLQSLFPVKYRWPELHIENTIENDYELIIDEELKRHVKTPLTSKFRDATMQLTDKQRRSIFISLLKNKPRTRRNIIEAFFIATFEAWKNYNRSDKERIYLGYSPIIGVDTEKILKDFPDAHIIHIVRNPYSAYADTKRRPVPYSVKRYSEIWSIVQYYAITFHQKYPDNFHLVKFEDLIENPKRFFKTLTKKVCITYEEILTYPSWNGKRLESVYPWGTIRTPTFGANKSTMEELSITERKEIQYYTKAINGLLGYDNL